MSGFTCHLVLLCVLVGGCAPDTSGSDNDGADTPLRGCMDPANYQCSGEGSQCLANCSDREAILCSGGRCQAGYGSSYDDCGPSSGQGCAMCDNAITGNCADLLTP